MGKTYTTAVDCDGDGIRDPWVYRVSLNHDGSGSETS